MSIIKVLFQSLLNEKKDEEITDSEIVVEKKKLKKTSQIVNKLEKGNNGIFGDEYEDSEEEDIEENIEEDEESSEDDNINFRDKDKEARQKYIEEVKKKLRKEADKNGNKSSGNKNGNKSGNKGNKGNKDSKYGKVSDKNLGKESHHIFTILKNIKLQQRLIRSKQRKVQRAVRRANFLRRQLRAHKFLLASHKRYVARRGFLFRKIKGILGNLIGKKKLMNLVAKRKLNVKKAKSISSKVKKVKKQALIAKKMFKKAKENKEQSFKKMLEAQRKSRKIEKGVKRGIGF